MDWTDPTLAAASSLDGCVLAVLAGTTERLTGREVHRRAVRGSAVGVRDTLVRLVDQGLVRREHAGPAHLYWLNREHVAAPVALALAAIRPTLFRRLRDALQGWDPAPLAAAVFGSVARGDGTPESDVDVLLVRPARIAADAEPWATQVSGLSDSVLTWTGNHASVLQVTPEDLDDLVRRDAPVLASLRRDAIDVGGAPIAELLGEAE